MGDPKKPAAQEPAPAVAAMSARARGLASVSDQLAETIASMRRSRDAAQSRLGVQAGPRGGPTAPALTPLPGGLAPAGHGDGELDRLRAELTRGRAAELELRNRLSEAEEASQRIGDELVAMEGRAAHATAVTVALRRLHEAPDTGEVVGAIAEVLVNIIGTEHFALLFEASDGSLAPVRVMGMAPARGADLGASASIRAAVASGATLLGRAAAALGTGLTAFVPLSCRGRAVGALAIARLLPQKDGLGPDDLEVLEILATHGAMAWLAARARETPGA
jgi:hypothetical protein